MSWEDRPYYRDRPSSGGNPLTWLMSGSVPLFTAYGIRVRMHASLIVFMALTILFSETNGGLGAKNAITSMVILFGSVLLHEFGHCFGARIMGGDAREILMWPLGGLAYTEPPHRPWPSLVTTAAGPLVNVVICIVTGLILVVLSRSASAIPWFPLTTGLRSYVPYDWTTYYIWWIFLVNYALVVFNLLLVFYPFDGGRIVQELLWFKFGYYKSMRFATVVGMIGASFLAAFGLATLSFMLVLIAAFGFMACYRQRQALQEAGPYEQEDAVDYTASIYGASSTARVRPQNSFLKKAAAKAKKRVAAEATERVKIDQILAKVSAKGMHSLTWFEKRTLRQATEQQRQRDIKTGRSRRG